MSIIQVSVPDGIYQLSEDTENPRSDGRRARKDWSYKKSFDRGIYRIVDGKVGPVEMDKSQYINVNEVPGLTIAQNLGQMETDTWMYFRHSNNLDQNDVPGFLDYLVSSGNVSEVDLDNYFSEMEEQEDRELQLMLDNDDEEEEAVPNEDQEVAEAASFL